MQKKISDSGLTEFASLCIPRNAWDDEIASVLGIKRVSLRMLQQHLFRNITITKNVIVMWNLMEYILLKTSFHTKIEDKLNFLIFFVIEILYQFLNSRT